MSKCECEYGQGVGWFSLHVLHAGSFVDARSLSCGVVSLAYVVGSLCTHPGHSPALLHPLFYLLGPAEIKRQVHFLSVSSYTLTFFVGCSV